MLSPSHCAELKVIASDSNMSRPIPQCAVASCRVWRSNQVRSNKQRWYSIKSHCDLLVGLLYATLLAEARNDSICPACYKRLRRRSQPPPHDLLDDLTAAMEERSMPPANKMNRATHA